MTQNCEKCYGRGYLVRGGNEDYSQASLCHCLSSCPGCGGSATVFTKDEKGYSYVAPCELCWPARLRVKRYNNARIPLKYRDVLQPDKMVDFRDRSQFEAMTYVKSFVDTYPEKKGFLLMGDPGLGKTILTVGVIAQLTLTKAVECIFTDFLFLLNDLKKAYSERIPENDIIGPLVNAEVLAIDEMGKGRSSEWELGILDQLISKRYNSSKKTLITTNYLYREFTNDASRKSTEILEDRVGERIASRLYEMCEPLLLAGEDHRKQRGFGRLPEDRMHP